MIIRTNALQAAQVLIKDMGVPVAGGGGQGYEPVGTEDLAAAAASEDLRRLSTDGAFGVDGSTLVIESGGDTIAAGDVSAFLDIAYLPTSGKYSVVTRDAAGDPPADLGGLGLEFLLITDQGGLLVDDDGKLIIKDSA